MASDFDSQRKRVREQITARQRDASEALESFLTASSNRVRETWRDSVRNYVEKVQPERTQELGSEAVKSLKADLADLDARGRSIVQSELDKMPVWNAYRTDNGPAREDSFLSFLRYHASYRYSHPISIPSDVQAALETATSRADDILRENGWDPEGNVPYHRSRRLRLIRLPQEPTDEMAETMAAFSAAAEAISKARKELKAIDTAESEDKAKSIWDEA